MPEKLMSQENARPKLNVDQIKAVVSSLIDKNNLNQDSLGAMLREKGISESDIGFIGGTLKQIHNDEKLGNLRTSEADEADIRNLKLDLASGINQMAQYLSKLEPADRITALTVAENLGQKVDSKRWSKIRQGAVATTGIYLIMQKAGAQNLSFPTPEEDVDYKIDLKTDKVLMQIKAKKDAKEVKIYDDPEQLKTETEGFISRMDPNLPQSASFAERLRTEAEKFEGLSEYANSQGLKAVNIVIPQSAIDYQSCESREGYDISSLQELVKPKE